MLFEHELSKFYGMHTSRLDISNSRKAMKKLTVKFQW